MLQGPKEADKYFQALFLITVLAEEFEYLSFSNRYTCGVEWKISSIVIRNSQ